MDRPKTNAQAIQKETSRRLNRFALSFLLAQALLVSACASYQTEVRETFDLMRSGRPAKAAEAIKPKAEKESDDQIVYLFEYGTALQQAKQYQESNQAFLKAEDLTDIKDYHSISRVSGSVLVNEGMVQYKGEDYEKVYLNAMLAINFLALGDREAAQVETRKLNEKLYKYKFEAKRDYNQDPFAFYLSAMIWESNRQWDDAYIDYKKAYELKPGLPYLKQDLLRLARLSQRYDDLRKWRREFPDIKPEDLKGKGEVVLILQQGWAPKKYPHPEFPRIPKLFPIYSFTQAADLVVDDQIRERSQKITSVADVAIKTLDDAYSGLVAKRAAGLVTKAVVSDQLRQKNELLGQLAWIGLNIADRADLRQWTTLPESFQVAKVSLKPGKYKIHAEGVSDSGQPSGERSDVIEIEIKSGQTVFIPWRTLK